MNPEIRAALDVDEAIDITTIGAKTGEPRRIEIWFRRVDGRFYITGTPRPRDWYANLLANPAFTFHLKESVEADLPATAVNISDEAERRRLLSNPEMSWFREQQFSIDDLVAASPLIEVIFD